MSSYKKAFAFCFITVVVVCVICFVNDLNPFSDVEWVEDYPGASDRYNAYTPVLRSDTSIKLGPQVGADYGKIHFRDLDNDGVKEVIIETDAPFYAGAYYLHERLVLRYQKDSTGKPQFVLMKSEVLGEAY